MSQSRYKTRCKDKKPEWFVMGSWAIHTSTGRLKHKPCGKWCDFFNFQGKDFHTCKLKEQELYEQYFSVTEEEYQRAVHIPIPGVVRVTVKLYKESANDGNS